jgi:hypothetical protein
MNGVWRVGPGIELFQALQAQLGEVPILAEDLGIITTDVVKLRWEWVTTVRRAQHTCAPPPMSLCAFLLFCSVCGASNAVRSQGLCPHQLVHTSVCAHVQVGKWAQPACSAGLACRAAAP